MVMAQMGIFDEHILIIFPLFWQQYEPGYTAPPKKSQIADAAMTIR